MLAQTFQIPVQDLNHHAFSSLRMLERSQYIENRDFMLVIVPAKSFGNFTIDNATMAPNTTIAPNTKIPIPTYAALLDSLIDTIVSTGQVFFAPAANDKDKKIARAIFQRMGLWYRYLMQYNYDYNPFIPEVISEKNRPIARFLALPMAVVSAGSWPKLCQLRGVVLHGDAIEWVLREDRFRKRCLQRRSKELSTSPRPEPSCLVPS